MNEPHYCPTCGCNDTEQIDQAVARLTERDGTRKRWIREKWQCNFCDHLWWENQTQEPEDEALDDQFEPADDEL